MDLSKDFAFQPLPTPVVKVEDGAGSSAAGIRTFSAASVEASTTAAKTVAKPGNPLGRLAGLVGKWEGTGFNTIWRPVVGKEPGNSSVFLELNLTSETLEFQKIEGAIPNRGTVQQDIEMFGLHYLQQISDKNLGTGLHFEPGIWAHVPATTHPHEPVTIVRMASIPHGTVVLAQGESTSADESVRPDIPRISINVSNIGVPSDPKDGIPDDLAKKNPLRTPAAGLVGITQRMVNDPNSVLRDAIAHQNITFTTRLQVTTEHKPVAGGGLANTAFLDGGRGEPNAVAAIVTSTYWLEKLDNETHASQLQYSQTVTLNFADQSWPHVTVATLRRV